MEEKELNRCEKCGANTQQCVDAPCQNYPIAEELNLCELLKGHEGECFFVPICGTEIELRRVHHTFLVFCIDNDNGCTIECNSNGKQQIGTIDDVGKFSTVTYPDGACMIYPNKALYEQYPLDAAQAWSVWQEEQKKPFICIHWGEVDCNGDIKEEDYTGNTYFRTPTERDKCIEEIKAIINKYPK